MKKNNKKNSGSKGNRRTLTDDERAMLKSDIAAGTRSTKQLAGIYNISERTVKRYKAEVKIEEEQAPPSPGTLLKALEVKRIENHLARAADMLMDQMEEVEKEKKYLPGEKITHIGLAVMNLSNIHRIILLSGEIIGTEGAGSLPPDIADMIVRLIPNENKGEVLAAIQASVQP